jgi:transcriptional regulator with XRE-family HTH domain
MPRPKKLALQPPSLGADLPYAGLGRQMNEWVLRWRARHARDIVYNQRAVAVEMGISATTFSNILNGRGRPTPAQCIILARFFEIPLEDLLSAAGYPDVAALRLWVINDPTPHDARERQYVATVLDIALRSKEWQQETWQQSPYKDRAEKALASTKEAYERAIEYADAVYDWGHSPERHTPRRDRTTEDLLTAVS